MQVAGDAGPHQVDHGAVAVVRVHTGASGLDELIPQRAQAGHVELAVGVPAAGPLGGLRRQHPVGADDLAGGVVADDQVIAEVVELVDVPAVHGAGQVGAELAGEDVVAQSLRGRDLALVVGQKE